MHLQSIQSSNLNITDRYNTKTKCMVVNACNMKITEHLLKRSKSKEEAMCFISKVRGLLQFMIFAYFVICHLQKKNNSCYVNKF